MKEKLQEIFRDVFDDENICLNREMTAEDIEAWDSLTYFELVMEVEAAFGIKLTTEEIATLESVGQMMDLIEKYTGEEK